MSGSFREQFMTTLEITCHEHDIDPHIVDTIFYIESSWNPWAVRYEPAWRYFKMVDEFARLLRITKETEHRLQMFSYGLGQIMGGSARHWGYTGPLTQILEPEINLDLVCKYLVKLRKLHPRFADQIAAYNAGSVRRNADGSYKNQEYVDKFFKRYDQLKAFWQKNTDRGI